MNNDDRFDSSSILGGLKDFQRATVEHAIGRLYADSDPTTKFLVADEVGLGKTLVARGVIARTIELLWDDVERIDIIYICSNRAIAEQNIRRLNVFDDTDFSFSSRMTMVAKEVSKLRGNKVNFVSFTPGTSFDLKSTLGVADERVLLFHVLRRLWGPSLLNSTAARRIFQGRLASLDRFDELTRGAAAWDLDGELIEQFEAELAATRLRDRFEELTTNFNTTHPDKAALSEQANIVGELRSRLAAQCVGALEPDLVVLDEFQRFQDLLADDSEAGELANALFDYPENRTLLLSATPYKMFTAASDDDNHHSDFVRTIDFLLGSDADRFHSALHQFQNVLLDVGRVSPSAIREARLDLEYELKRVMSRTERLASDITRNGMLTEITRQISGLQTDDVMSYVALEQLSKFLGGSSMTEYWKSAPYFLNFTDGYKLDQHLTDALNDPERCDETRELVAAVGAQVDWDAWRSYRSLDPANPRLRHLAAETTGEGRWKMLWLAPSLPYYDLEGPWAEPGAAEFTKRLIFSSWSAVPKAIASMLSYEAERQIMDLRPEAAINDAEERKKIKGPLQFRRNPAGQPAAMSAFGLLYPSFVLARELDPITVLQGDASISQKGLKKILTDIVTDRLDELPDAPSEGRVDESWYWAAPMLMDLSDDAALWMRHKRLYLHSWLGGEQEGGADDPDSSFREHIELAHRVARGEETLGRRPDDLADVIVLNALGNPATLALRALKRVLGDDGERHAWDGACRIAWGFRSLFNIPEASTLIRHLYPSQPYWRAALQYSADGCLSAVLDEYVHCLREWLGIVEVTSWNDVNKIAEECSSAVSLKSADYVAKDHLGVSGKPEQRFRSRFALRLSNERSESDAAVIRVGNVRTSFNSPFWPFVLASTSIGQEGLDFHLYCHAIVHWNLPSNPVDLEQREGRVHRFKGHAIRRNIAAAHAPDAWNSTQRDIWQAMFDAASVSQPDANDLVPYWVYPGPRSIERHVLALPMSREVGDLSRLKRSVALYRLVFGQPRQDDLIEYLSGVDDKVTLDELRIDLSPTPLRR